MLKIFQLVLFMTFWDLPVKHLSFNNILSELRAQVPVFPKEGLVNELNLPSICLPWTGLLEAPHCVLTDPFSSLARGDYIRNR